MNYADIDYIEVLLNPQQYNEMEIERALEIDCKSRIALRKMLENVEDDDEYVKKQDVIDLCYMLQDKSSKQGQVLFEQIISAIEDMKSEEYNTKKS